MLRCRSGCFWITSFRRFATKGSTSIGRLVVPQNPVFDDSKQHLVEEARSRVSVEPGIIDHLERLSLVDFANKRGIERLIEAIQFVQPIRFVDTEGVEPLITVLEDRDLFLDCDEIRDGNKLEDILANAAVTEEEYFVAPPGNIPLDPKGSYADRPEPVNES